MLLENDIYYRKLDELTLARLHNVFKNANVDDAADLIFNVFYLAEKSGEIEKEDMFRLSFKALNSYNIIKTYNKVG